MTAQVTEVELIQGASQGQRAALAALVDACVTRQFVGVTPFESLTMAEGFGRLAAAHGDPSDNMMLAGILRVRAHHVAELGDMERARSLLLQSEFLCDAFPSLALSGGVEFLAGVLTAEADAGDEVAAARLNLLTAALSPADADRLRHTLNKACSEHRKAGEAVLNG